MGYLIYEITLDLIQYCNTDISTQKIGYYLTWLGYEITLDLIQYCNTDISTQKIGYYLTWLGV